MNTTLQKILASRPDLSDYLFHFTKGSKAKGSLESIIRSGMIRDINKTGRICFTEAPLLMLDDMFKVFDPYSEPMYARYGIAVKKRHIFDLGGRPIISGSINEKELLPEGLRWRFEELNPSVRDFSWLREWRLKSDALSLDPVNCFIVTNTTDELEMLIADWEDVGEIEFDGCVDDGQYWATAYYEVQREFQGVSFAQIREIKGMGEEELKRLLRAQHIGEVIGTRSLGSTTF